MDDGTTITRTEGGGYLLQFKRRLEREVERVWAAILDPEQRAVWFFGGRLDPVVGGVVQLQDSGHGITGEVVEIEPPRLLELTWRSIDSPIGVVRFELHEDGPTTVLRFSHIVDATAHAENLLPGWHCIFDDLPLFLAGQAVDEVPGRFAALKAAYVARLDQG